MNLIASAALLKLKITSALSLATSKRRWCYCIGGVLALLALAACLFVIEMLSAVVLTGKFLYKEDAHYAQNAVIEVTDTKGFFQASKKNRIVEFYSPYCGHCISFKKTYLTVANEASRKYNNAGRTKSIEFYAVSCAGMPELCQQYTIDRYPSIYSIPAGSYEVNKQREMGTLVFSLHEVEKAFNLTTTTTTTTIPTR